MSVAPVNVIAAQPQIVVMQQPQMPVWAVNKAQPGGTITNEKYFGPISCLICIFVGCCPLCCPCDQRQVYTDPQGAKINEKDGIC